MTEDEARAQLKERVSRETFARLELYETELRRWQGTINLVASSTLDQVWLRHFLDSCQVFDLRPTNTGHWLDIGSGGGFPGLVCAILAAEDAPEMGFTFIESDLRKCSFLRETARKAGIAVRILSRRIEDAPPQSADVISARALASLDKLCALAEPHLKPDAICLFQKGKTHMDELAAATGNWRMKQETFPSKTDAEAVIYRIKELTRG